MDQHFLALSAFLDALWWLVAATFVAATAPLLLEVIAEWLKKRRA